MKQTIYVALLDEGTECWRPVEAEHQGDDLYLVTEHNLHPDDEKWKFQTGDAVCCRMHNFGGITRLVAFKNAR